MRLLGRSTNWQKALILVCASKRYTFTLFGPHPKQLGILALLLFFIYINDLSDDLASNSKLFADNTSLFSVVKNIDASNIDLSNDLKKIGEWAFQRKMSFNPDPTKQAFFNENVVPKTTLQKHLGMFLYSKLNFSEQLKTIFQKTNKTIGLLCKLKILRPRAPLITI